MVTDEGEFNPYHLKEAKRLSVKDLNEFIKLKEIQGRVINEDVAREIIVK